MDNFGESKCEATAEEVLQNNFQGSIDREPALGLEFDDNESAFNFYNEYARRISFTVHKENLNDVQTHEIDLAEDAGLFSKGTFDIISLQAGGRANLGYTKLDHKNYLRTKRQKAMGQGEARVLLEYFEKKKVDDPSFFFVVQLDVNDMITNIFWADSKMIIDYEIFGDVLSFDTTYQTNKEHRPLASFLGFNNHRKMIIFGGALMYDETS
ncbi:protein FAR1-RELATED SEQUENCE 5-like [Nicotiana tabacum]|uniref:Protein FAR1-RELATED SEQUENCE 5-like n=2 Tax=Nicotiana TaxID=4085 RepID=A0A1S4CKP9_TOBAC|nr:PREDICTED: protein FAR1-RELATED SEQUENCE 5-like [Nicotiana sylvestris]XP_016501812.1 PREDICTED: protein FAR1-RELATED SEQUENCE 5-like [Nicotiana tabacum]